MGVLLDHFPKTKAGFFLSLDGLHPRMLHMDKHMGIAVRGRRKDQARIERVVCEVPVASFHIQKHTSFILHIAGESALPQASFINESFCP